MAERKDMAIRVGEPVVFSPKGRESISVSSLEQWLYALKRDAKNPINMVKIEAVKSKRSVNYDEYTGYEDEEEYFTGDVHMQGIYLYKETDEEYQKRMISENGLEKYIKELMAGYEKKMVEYQSENAKMRGNISELVRENESLKKSFQALIEKQPLSMRPPDVNSDEGATIGQLTAELQGLKARRDELIELIEEKWQEHHAEKYNEDWWEQTGD